MTILRAGSMLACVTATSTAFAWDPDDDSTMPASKIQPERGVEEIKAAPPTWCQGTNASVQARGYDNSAAQSGKLSDDVRHELEANPRRPLTLILAHRVAWSACLFPNSTKRQAWNASIRQGILNATGGTIQEDVALMRFLVTTPLESVTPDGIGKVCTALNITSAAPEDVVLIAARQVLSNCGASNEEKPKEEAAWGYVLRKGDLVNPIVLTAYINKELPLSSNFDDSLDAVYAQAIARSIYDIRAFERIDRAAFARAVDAINPSPIERINLTRSFSFTKARVAKLLAMMGPLRTKFSAQIEEVVFNAPMRGYEDWTKQASAFRATLDLASQYEAKFLANEASKSALVTSFQGCEAPLRKGLHEYVRSRNPKRGVDARSAASDPMGILIVAAVAACDAIGGRFGAADPALRMLDSSYRFGGPRAASILASTKALATIEADRNDFPLKMKRWGNMDDYGDWARDAANRVAMPFNKLNNFGTWTDLDESDHSDEEGKPKSGDAQIKTVDVKPDGVVLTFVPVSWKEPTHECWYTNKVDRIEWFNGNAMPRYEQRCRDTGLRTVVSRQNPVVVPRASADGLRAGLYTRLAGYYWPDDQRSKGPDTAIVLEAYSDPARKNLVYAFGASLTGAAASAPASAPPAAKAAPPAAKAAPPAAKAAPTSAKKKKRAAKK